MDRALAEAYAGLMSRPDVNVPALYSRLADQPLFSIALDRSLTNAEIGAGLELVGELLPERAPVLQTQFEDLARSLKSTLQTDPASLSAAAKGDRDTALQRANALCQEAMDVSLNALAQGEHPPAYDGRQPFRGLSPFRAEDREFFFGRETLVQALLAKLKADNFLAVLGPSGSGKSSVVLAGVVPHLRQQEPGLHVIDDLTPSTTPLAQLRMRQEKLQPGPVLYIIDQFEELFTLCRDEAERKAFIEELVGLARIQRVILTMRADFWGECASYPELKEKMLAHQDLIAPLTMAELRAAMEQQAAKVGLRFEADLANTILEEVAGEPGAMPLLQHALLELWKRRHGRWLKTSEYRTMGGVKTAIAQTADRIYNELPPESQATVRNILLRLTRVDETEVSDGERRDTRRRLPLVELVPAQGDPELTKALVKRLADAVLVVTSRNKVTGQAEVEVAHEAIIRHWARLRSWLDEDLKALRFRESIGNAARDWDQHSCNEDFLLHVGRRFEDVASLSQDSSLNTLEVEYLRNCAQKDRDLRLNPGIHNLQEGGWGVIFATGTDPATIEALRPLLGHRKGEATKRYADRYKEFSGEAAFRPEDSAFSYLQRQGLGPGQEDPGRVPRFLLIVGSPTQIPFEMQYDLVQLGYSVGRIYFETPEAYRNYALKIVSCEQNTQPVSKRLAIFGPSHGETYPTKLTSQRFLPSFIAALRHRLDWDIEPVLGSAANKARLLELINGPRSALHFWCAHGLAFKMGNPRQSTHQSSIVCSDWPGLGSILPEHILGPDEIGTNCNLHGSIMVLFVEHSAGTPKFSDFNPGGGEVQQLATDAMLSPFSTRLLSLPLGPLAIIGHVDVFFAYSFMDDWSGRNDRATESEYYAVLALFADLMRAYPIGTAARHMRSRYEALRLAFDALEAALDKNDRKLMIQRIKMIDARNWVILGDPAARLALY